MSRKAANFGALRIMLMMAGEGSAKVPQYFAEPGSAAPFSAAVRAGDFIFASGQIGITANGEIPASIEDQARLAMDNLQQAFKSAGAELSDVVKCTVMLADMADRFHFLNYGLAAVLSFIGIKMLIMDFYKIPIAVSLGAVFVLVAGSMVASLMFPAKAEHT